MQAIVPRSGRGARSEAGGRPRDAGRRYRRGIVRSGRQPIRGLGSLYLLGLIAVAVLATGIYVNAISAGPAATSLVVPVVVDLGPPVLGQVDCGNSSTLYTEVIAWNHSSSNLTPTEVYVKLVELVDGDFIGARDPPATVTPSNVCAGKAPSAPYDWYLVVGAPHGGPNLDVFCYVTSWTAVGGASLSAPIANGSTLTLVSVRSFASNGYGLAIEGAVGGPAVRGEVTL